MSRQVIDKCPSCYSDRLRVFYRLTGIPVHSCQLCASEEEARSFPTGDLSLASCEVCGFITNVCYDELLQEYSSAYEDQQCFSPTFNSFARDLAAELVERHKLYNKDIVEIGCSKGDFLDLLCSLGENRGVGIDPSCGEGRLDGEVGERIRFVSERYSVDHGSFPCDFLCCRHTLEHIGPVGAFMETVRRSIGDQKEVTVFFEVPETIRVLREQAFWDIYYEHCSYFTPGSLIRLFRRSGFEVMKTLLAYDGQYLLLEAKPSDGSEEKSQDLEESPEELAREVQAFTEGIQERIAEWRDSIQGALERGEKVAIWGSGSKCVAFLTTLKLADNVDSVVDINPYRHGKYLPSLGIEILPPETLKVRQPDLVIVMNSIYLAEIGQMLEDMGVSAELRAV